MTDSGMKLQKVLSGTDKPAVAVAPRFLLLPRTIAANDTGIETCGVVTWTKRMLPGVAYAVAKSTYVPSKLTAKRTAAGCTATLELLKLYLFISCRARAFAEEIPLGDEFKADAAARAAASAAFCSSFFAR